MVERERVHHHLFLDIYTYSVQKATILLGIAVTLTSDFCLALQKAVQMAAIYIFKEQQRKFIRKLQSNGGNIIIIIDGTYSVRGSHSPDCLVWVKMK